MLLNYKNIFLFVIIVALISTFTYYKLRVQYLELELEKTKNTLESQTQTALNYQNKLSISEESCSRVMKELQELEQQPIKEVIKYKPQIIREQVVLDTKVTITHPEKNATNILKTLNSIGY